MYALDTDWNGSWPSKLVVVGSNPTRGTMKKVDVQLTEEELSLICDLIRYRLIDLSKSPFPVDYEKAKISLLNNMSFNLESQLRMFSFTPCANKNE